MNQFRYRLQRFMAGRHGNDALNNFLMGLAIVIFIVSIFTTKYLYFVAIAIIIFAYYRIFSKKLVRRYKENQWYLKRTAGIRRFFGGLSQRFKHDAKYKIFKCPKCKQKIRIPRGHGRIEIRCRMCGEQFIRKS